ncbi:MAG: EamA family transporter [Ignavibacteriales bacterium]|nr:EamA family transporter [Ignavibacteriales bacterium]
MFWFALASCSALLSAAAAVIQKKVLFRLTALEFSFFVSVIILIFSLFIPLSMDVTSITPSMFLIIVGKSILGGAAFLFVMMSLEYNQISTALPILGMTPAVTALAALLIIGESLHQWEWLGIGMMMAGTYVLEKRPAQKFFQPFKEMLRLKNHYYMYGALGLFSVSSVFDKLLMSGYKTDPLVVLFYQHIVYCVMFGSLLFIRKQSFQAAVQKGALQLPFIVAVAFLTIAYRFTQLEATKFAPVALVLAVKRTSILYASFYGGKIFSEERLAQKLIGGALIVGAGFIILRNVG